MRARILVLDDDAAVVEFLCESLAERYDTVGVTSPAEALAAIERSDFDLVISDVEMPGMRGIDLIAALHESRPDLQVLLITAFGSVEMAVQAVRAGACDFLTKPFKLEALTDAIERACAERGLRREVVRVRSAPAADAPERMVARSQAMRRVLDLARRAAHSHSSILITGETGTGKSALARFIHDQSPRRDQPFVQLNCAAMPPNLAESELFGVRRGAFTDARTDRVGMFVAAGSGTLFLDEIGDLSVEVQAKLLHALETDRVRPLGGTAEVEVKARVIAATNRAPEALLREGTFRPDLYYRINVIRIDAPPLRERREDIAPLVDTFLGRACEQHRRPLMGISARAMKLLARHAWPGNVRELANVIERAVAMAEHDAILPEDLHIPASSAPMAAPLEAAAQANLPLDAVERAYIQHVVNAHGGNKAAAARVLGITRRTLYRKLEG